MNLVIKQFATECHDILKKNPGAEGLEQIRQRLQKILVNEAVIKDILGPDR